MRVRPSETVTVWRLLGTELVAAVEHGHHPGRNKEDGRRRTEENKKNAGVTFTCQKQLLESVLRKYMDGTVRKSNTDAV